MRREGLLAFWVWDEFELPDVSRGADRHWYLGDCEGVFTYFDKVCGVYYM